MPFCWDFVFYSGKIIPMMGFNWSAGREPLRHSRTLRQTRAAYTADLFQA
jgi:hypothetical protein